MLKIAVCDDDDFSLNEADKIIRRSVADLDISLYHFKTKSDFDAIFDSADTFFDIVVLDIEMPDVNGVDFAEAIRQKNKRTRIIFLTNHLEYATEVYNTEHTFYVLKKDAAERLPAAIRKAAAQLEIIRSEVIAVNGHHTEQVIVAVNDILYLERILRDTVLYTTDGVVHTTESLDSLAKRVSPGTLTRIYRSYTVNIRHIRRLLGDEVILSDGTKLPVGRTYAKQLKEDLMRYIKQSSQTNF